MAASAAGFQAEQEKQKYEPSIANDRLLLKVFPSKFGLPSFDVDSLAVLAYSRFGNAALDVQKDQFARFGFIANAEPIPSLTSRNAKAESPEEIFDLLRASKFGIDFHLSQKDSADAVAFIALMQAKLRPAVLHTFWLEEGNYEAVTREAYATEFSIPAAIFQPRWRRLAASDFVYTSHGSNLNVLSKPDIERKVYQDAFACINDLSSKLGTQAFLFGDTPTTADALMFGYLAPILYITLPKSRLKVHLEAHTNLCNTINHIKRVYFPPDIADLSKQRQEAYAKFDEEDKEFPHQTRNMFIAAVFGVTVMFTYIILRGVISIRIEDDFD